MLCVMTEMVLLSIIYKTSKLNVYLIHITSSFLVFNELFKVILESKT